MADQVSKSPSPSAPHGDSSRVYDGYTRQKVTIFVCYLCHMTILLFGWSSDGGGPIRLEAETSDRLAGGYLAESSFKIHLSLVGCIRKWEDNIVETAT